MAVHVSHASLPYPIKGARFTTIITYVDADGDPTDPTTPDTELSIDGASFADAAEEASVITGANGEALFTFTGAETNCSALGLAAKVASGPKAPLRTYYPRALVSLGTGTLSAGSAGGGTLGTILPWDLAGCFIKTTGGTGGGGTGGANNQARKIMTYTPSTGAFTVAPNWETTPDNTTTYDVLLPEGRTPADLRAFDQGLALVGEYPQFGIIDSGTLQAYTSGTPSVTLRSAAAFGDNTLAGCLVLVKGSSTAVYWQARNIVSNVGSTDVATIDSAFTVAPTGTISYIVLGTPPGADSAGVATLLSRLTSTRAGYLDNLSAALATNTDMATVLSRLSSARAGYLDNLNVGGNVASSAQATTIAGYIDTEVAAILAAVDTEVAAILTAVTSGGVAIADGYLTAAKFAANAISAAKIATDALTAIAQAVRDVQTTASLPNTSTRPTLGEAARYNYLHNRRRSISGTTETINTEAGGAAATNTLNDASNPTSIVAAT